jgi:two-component system, NarL family, response regulator NreC
MTPPPRSLIADDKVRIVVADDHLAIRSGLRLLLMREPDFDVVGEAGDAGDAVRSVVETSPAVLVLDLNMPGQTTSLAAIPQVRRRSPGTAIVILTMEADPSFARRALHAGAAGYVLKESAESELVDAVRTAAAGGTYVAPKLGAALATTTAESASPPDSLTGRELAVLRLVALGHTNGEIAERMIISVRTVEAHRAKLQRKLERWTRAALVRYALDHGLLAG